MPRYILDLATVRTYLQICQNVAENLSKRLMSMSQEVPQGRQQLPTHMQPSQATSPPMAPPMSDATILQRANPTPSPRPPSQQARPLVPQPPQSNVPTPQPTQPSPRTQPVQTTPIPAPAKVPKKSAVAAEGTASTSTPPASASTPANPPTPSHVASSPQTPKSPKTKAPPKPKPKRKPSVKGQQPTISVPNPPASAATPTADQSSPAAATPESGNKRKREDDVVTATPVSSDPSPSKKPKTDWEGPESEELQQKKQAVEGVKTDEDATKFLENMTEMLAMVSGEGKQVPAEISDTLDQILSNLSDSVTGIGTLGDASGVRSSTPPIASNGGDGLEYFDFSLYNEDDRGSKAPTPDLVQTSSTNPSPGSDADSSHGPLSTVPDTARIADSKIEDELDGSDPLRLSFWSEVGGGEAAYFNSDPWKWEGSMPTSDQPWAILDR